MSTQKVTEQIREVIRDFREHREDYYVSRFTMTIKRLRESELLVWRVVVDRPRYTGEAVVMVSTPIAILAVKGIPIDRESTTVRTTRFRSIMAFASVIGLLDDLPVDTAEETVTCKDYWLLGGGFEAVRCRTQHAVHYLFFYGTNEMAEAVTKRIGTKKVTVVRLKDRRVVKALRILFGTDDDP